VLLFHDPTTSYRFRAKREPVPPPGTAGYPVPARKSLFGKQGERGLPIGNLTSQFWGNVYLSEVDHFVKRRLGVRRYLRYVDDMVLVDPDRARLEDAHAAIAAFLQERLGLTLRRDRTEPQPVGRGVEFVGWKTWCNRRLPRRRTVGNLETKLDAFERRLVRAGPLPGQRSVRLDGARRAAEIERARATLAAYSGHLRHGAAWGAWSRTWERHQWLGVLWRRDGWWFRPRWEPRRTSGTRNLGGAYRALTARLDDVALAFWPCGRFVEFYGPQRLVAERVLGLRRTDLPRAGYAFTVGFPVWRWGEYARRTLDAGRAVIVVQRRGVDLRVARGAVPVRIVL
jgi:hypothetical protein